MISSDNGVSKMCCYNICFAFTVPASVFANFRFWTVLSKCMNNKVISSSIGSGDPSCLLAGAGNVSLVHGGESEGGK